MMDKITSCPDNISKLPYDTACLMVDNELGQPVDIYSLSSDCHQCDPQFWTTLPLNVSLSLVTPSAKPLTLYAFRPYANESICQKTLSLNQHELLSWTIGDNCTFTVQDEGENANLPMHVSLAAFVAILLLIAVVRSLLRVQWLKNLCARDPTIIDMQNDLGNPSSSDDSLPLVQSELVPLRRLNSPRIQALDTFRGLTIALMIFVNYGGGKYWFFEHSAWNGLTMADMVFPWFAWAMGFSLVLSYRSKLRSCVSRGHVLVASVRRAALLIGLGLMLNSYNDNDVATLRYCGVLQRLGLAHLVAASVETAFMKKQPAMQYGRCLRFLCVPELVETWRQWLVILSLTGVHLYFTLSHPVPGCPTGYLGPGGWAEHGTHQNCTGGAARYIDSLVFGDAHLYQRSPARKVYHTVVPFDPEGILGTLTTCLTVYLGVLAGYIILTYNTTTSRSLRWLGWAYATGVMGAWLCNWSLEESEGAVPINKQLWSLSFTLVTASAAFVLFTVLFVVIDHCRWWDGGLFKYAGMNAILLYVGHIVTHHTLPWSWKVTDVTSHAEFFYMNCLAVAIWLIVAKILHRHQIYLTI